MAEPADDREVRPARKAARRLSLGRIGCRRRSGDDEKSSTARDNAYQAQEAAGRRPARGHDRPNVVEGGYTGTRTFATRRAIGADPGAAVTMRSTCPRFVNTLESARDAASRSAWREAHEAYAGVDANSLTAGDLEAYAEAAWWRGKLDEAIGLRERAYAAFTSAGDKLGAARLALALSWDYEGRGAFAVSQGWFANAERLLEGQPESPEHSRLLLFRAIAAMFAVRQLRRRREALRREAYALAGRVGDRDGQILSLSGKGRSFIKGGNVEAGLALLDEATASATCGELRPHSTGLVYCITISSCQDLGDYRRAAEWTEAANRWCDRLDVTGFPGACRIHRAEAMRLRGDWPGAEAQALEACEELLDFDRTITASGYYEVGEIRRKRGDFAAAEEAYRTTNELGGSAEPGLSLLRLAQGKVDAAVAGVAHTLRETKAPLARIRRLPAQVEIAVAAGDLRTARAAADELEAIVDSYKIGDRRAPAFDAKTHYAHGQIKLAEKDWDAAVASLQHARDEWQGVGAPYETAGGATPPRHCVPTTRRGSRRNRRARRRACRIRTARSPYRLRADEGASRQASSEAHVPVHRHRRLDATP